MINDKRRLVNEEMNRKREKDFTGLIRADIMRDLAVYIFVSRYRRAFSRFL
jgi:hypothetical protein